MSVLSWIWSTLLSKFSQSTIYFRKCSALATHWSVRPANRFYSPRLVHQLSVARSTIRWDISDEAQVLAIPAAHPQWEWTSSSQCWPAGRSLFSYCSARTCFVNFVTKIGQWFRIAMIGQSDVVALSYPDQYESDREAVSGLIVSGTYELHFSFGLS